MAVQEEPPKEICYEPLSLTVRDAGAVLGQLMIDRSCRVTLLPGADPQPFVEDLVNLHYFMQGRNGFAHVLDSDVKSSRFDLIEYATRCKNDGLIIMQQRFERVNQTLGMLNERDQPMVCVIGTAQDYAELCGNAANKRKSIVGSRLLDRLKLSYTLNAQNTVGGGVATQLGY